MGRLIYDILVKSKLVDTLDLQRKMGVHIETSLNIKNPKECVLNL